jgi:hypothetical protein
MRMPFLSAIVGILFATAVQANTIHVSTNSLIDGPGTNWTNAFQTIQGAVDAAVAGDTVLVADGAYEVGGKVISAALVSRVAINKPITVRSVNGPAVTTIVGAGPVGGYGVRCAYVGTDATLCGFTLTNGATRQTGDQFLEGSGGGAWCETSAIVSNCVLVGNAAWIYGGGVYGGTLYGCEFTGNSASSGGGSSDSDVNNSVFTGNSAGMGGGSFGGTLNNCTLTANSAGAGGGSCSGVLNNCIIYYNTAGGNVSGSTLSYCCTTPGTGGTGNIASDPQLASTTHLSLLSPCIGNGNSGYSHGLDLDGEQWRNPPSMGADEPRSGSATGLLSVAISGAYSNVAVGATIAFTACIAGRTTASAWDFGDGVVANNRPYVSHAWTTPGSYALTLTAYNDEYPLGVTAVLQVTVVGASTPIYVNAANTTPVFPYTNWTTAATTIQQAIDSCIPGCHIIIVTNGTYSSGSKTISGSQLRNRVAVERPMTVQSVNGPEATIIAATGVKHMSAMRGVYLCNNSLLIGFTVMIGTTKEYYDGYTADLDTCGAGIWCEPSAVVSNCIIKQNWADGSGGGVYGGTLYNCTISGGAYWGGSGSGGGAYNSKLYNCTITGCSAGIGGGVYKGTLYNCTLTGNSASSGGGAESATLYNCMLVGNSVGQGGGGAWGSTLYNCALIDNHAGSS